MTRAEQREQTRRTLLQESRRLFATQGYAAVGLAEIVRAAGVTKGALYHHFDGKTALFRAVLEQTQQEVGRAVAAAADTEDDPWDQLLAGCRTFLAVSADPDIRQIMLLDGPAVLGWNEWRTLDETASARHLADALTDLINRGILTPQPVEPLTRLLSGAMNEAALWLASSTDPTDLTNAQDVLTRMLTGLRTT